MIASKLDIALIDKIFYELEGHSKPADRSVMKTFIDKFPADAFKLLNDRLELEGWALALTISERYLQEEDDRKNH